MIERRANPKLADGGTAAAGRTLPRRSASAGLLLSAAALLLLTGAAAGAEDDDDPPHLTVRGTASLPAVPDVAVLRLGVSAEDAAAAIRADAAALSAVTEAAAAQGIAAADVATESTTLQPVSPEAPANGPRVFRAATTLRLRLRDLGQTPGQLQEKVGAVLAALAAKGAVRVENVDYRLADASALLAKATGLAVADARRRAEAAAGAANVSLGPVLSIEPPDEPAGGSRLDRVPGGEERDTVSTTVEVTYAINP